MSTTARREGEPERFSDIIWRWRTEDVERVKTAIRGKLERSGGLVLRDLDTLDAGRSLNAGAVEGLMLEAYRAGMLEAARRAARDDA